MRKFSKRVLAVTLSAAMVFSLAACNKSDSNGTTTTAGTTAEGTTDEGTTNAPVADGATYTYNYALVDFPTNWNMHTYQTEIDTDILNYITEGSLLAGIQTYRRGQHDEHHRAEYTY